MTQRTRMRGIPVPNLGSVRMFLYFRTFWQTHIYVQTVVYLPPGADHLHSCWISPPEETAEPLVECAGAYKQTTLVGTSARRSPSPRATHDCRADGDGRILQQGRHLLDLPLGEQSALQRLLPDLLDRDLYHARPLRAPWADGQLPLHPHLDEPFSTQALVQLTPPAGWTPMPFNDLGQRSNPSLENGSGPWISGWERPVDHA
jgi:hypothetical protein